MSAESLPTVTHTSVMDILGFKLTCHVLSNGQRVFEDTPELRELLATMTGTEPDNSRFVEHEPLDDKAEGKEA